jgi:AcrR family transcriptional regulator
MMPQKKDPNVKRIQILEALNQCLQEKPFDKTSIKDIARKAGVNHGLLHYYFKNKEDLLIQYIDHVIDHYKSLFEEWKISANIETLEYRQRIEDFFEFMNTRITLDKSLSKVFIEIWEIAAYNPNIRSRLQAAYEEWIRVLTQMFAPMTKDPETARQTSIAAVAYFEGMALFSIILNPKTFDCHDILKQFQKKIIDSL